jgi:uncharacterized protein
MKIKMVESGGVVGRDPVGWLQKSRNFVNQQSVQLSPSLSMLLDQVVRIAHPLRIILFGSVARGQVGPESDIDLLVVMPNGTHRRHTAQRLYASIHHVSVPFDLLVATPSDLDRHCRNVGLIYSAILEEGVEVYAAD